MTFRQPTLPEIQGLTARLAEAASGNMSSTDRLRFGDVIRTECHDYEHAEAVVGHLERRAEARKRWRGVESIRLAIEETLPQGDLREGWDARNRILESFPHDFLSLFSIPDRGFTVVRHDDFWTTLGVKDDDPIRYRINPAPFNGPCMDGCRWHYIKGKRQAQNVAIDRDYVCFCRACEVRQKYGTPEAWHDAYRWAERHAPDGTAVQEYHPVRARFAPGEYEELQRGWVSDHPELFRKLIDYSMLSEDVSKILDVPF